MEHHLGIGLPFNRRCGVVNDGNKANGKLYKLFRSVGNVTTKGQGITGFEQIGGLPVAVLQLSFQNIDEFGAGMLEGGEDL